jgi:hypothetical protein
MGIDGEMLEQAVLALFQMTLSGDTRTRAWKSLPSSVLDTFHQQLIFPIQLRKTGLYGLTEKGAKLSEEFFEKFFAAQ